MKTLCIKAKRYSVLLQSYIVQTLASRFSHGYNDTVADHIFTHARIRMPLFIGMEKCEEFSDWEESI